MLTPGKPTDPPVNSARAERGKGLVLPASGVLPVGIIPPVTAGMLDAEDSTDGQVLTSDGAGVGGWETIPSQLGGAWTTWVPALTAATTSPTLGTGSTATGRYLQLGKLVIARAVILFGTSGTNAGSGIYYVSLPVNASTELGGNSPMGSNGIITNEGIDNYLVVPAYQAADKVRMIVEAGNEVTHAAPFAWGASDGIQLLVIYEAA